MVFCAAVKLYGFSSTVGSGIRRISRPGERKNERERKRRKERERERKRVREIVQGKEDNIIASHIAGRVRSPVESVFLVIFFPGFFLNRKTNVRKT